VKVKRIKMNIEFFRDYCIGKKGVTEEFPFGEETLVFKVMGKMFALTHIDSFSSINLKCNPEKALELREQYACVKPGYHMNKNHWNTVMIDGSVSDKLIKEWVDDSYHLVVASLTKKLQQELAAL
jgi:predicted DNA-binding protein (MmcQ/YjbR family)